MSVDDVDLEESGEVQATVLVKGRLLSSPVEIRFRLFDGEDRIDIFLDLDWREERPIRVQMVFPVGKMKADTYYGVPFGFNTIDGIMPGCEPRGQAKMPADQWENQRVCQGWIAVDRGGDGLVAALRKAQLESS